MKTSQNQKEILLIVKSSFFSRDWVKINETEADRRLSRKETIIDACWNGMTPQILPEFFEGNTQSSTLWEINDTKTFLNLEFGAYNQGKEKVFSVNPYVFMEVQGLN